jgi:hypothetical protein
MSDDSEQCATLSERLSDLFSGRLKIARDEGTGFVDVTNETIRDYMSRLRSACSRVTRCE